MENLIGHNQQREALRRQFEHKQLPHALLFSGPSGIGKSLVARELAITLLSTETSADQIENATDKGNHPDFFFIDCQDTEQASTEEVRKLLHSLHLKSYAGPNRVVILNNVHYLNAQALNALLKSLEEPRPGTYFILVTSHPNNLLKTILSRCQIWSFHSLSEEELQQVLEQKKDEFPSEHMAVLSFIADGSLENVFRLSNHIHEWQEMRRSLLQISLGD
ncbi:MAG: AAA family ATPase, partial [Bdellovibrionales bacterium]|nr:AAA family ATPase [Bdellovibrionales bacterium]